MVVLSYSGKEINAKLVYYGAGLSGKTTNLEAIYEAVPESSRGKMVSMKTQSDRTLFFDLLPLDLGEIMGFRTRFLLYTVPGQVFYNATRKLVLKGADGIVFVADSAVGKMDENKESIENLRTNLAEYGLRMEDIPSVLQYNKRDLPNVHSIEELNAVLNPDGRLQVFEAVATQGVGVFETFRGISHLLMQKVTRELHRATQTGRGPRSEMPRAPQPGAAAPAAPPAPPAGRAVAPVLPGPLAPPKIAHEPRATPPARVSEPVTPASFGRASEQRLAPPRNEGAAPSLDDEEPVAPGRMLGEPADPRSAAGHAPPGLAFEYTREIDADRDAQGPEEKPPTFEAEHEEEAGDDLVVEREPTVGVHGSTGPRAAERPRTGFGERTLAFADDARPAPAAAASASAQPIVVPVTIPAGTTREIVLRIVIRSEG